MPRVLSDESNDIILNDRLSNCQVVLQYRTPTNKETVNYAAGNVSNQGKKAKVTMGETRLKYGLRILTGFRKGDFELPGGKVFSSDENDPAYDPNWKAHLKKYAADLICTMAFNVFELSAIKAEELMDEDHDDEDLDDDKAEEEKEEEKALD